MKTGFANKAGVGGFRVRDSGGRFGALSLHFAVEACQLVGFGVIKGAHVCWAVRVVF